MRKINVHSMVSLDGVIQGPGSPKEDTSNGFEYGGWVAPYDDNDYDEEVRKELDQPSDFLLGRFTFIIWEKYWPFHNDIWPGINEGTKYVFSQTRNQSNWENSVFIKDVAEIRNLKNSPGRDIQVWGSSQLIQLLLQNDLIDNFYLKIHPLVLGRGKMLFNQNFPAAAFSLERSSVTSKGVIIAQYKRSGDVVTGDLTQE